MQNGIFQIKQGIMARKGIPKMSNPTSLYMCCRMKPSININRYQSNYGGDCQNCLVVKSLVFNHVINHHQSSLIINHH